MKGTEVWRISSKSAVKWRRNAAGWSLNERKWSDDKCSEVMCSEGLSNRVSNIIRIYIYIYISYEVFCLYGFFIYHILSFSFGYIFYHFIYGCMFSVLLFNCINYVLFIVMYVIFCVFCLIVLFCVLFVCKCVMCYCHQVPTKLQ
jgi:hypothetical protein